MRTTPIEFSAGTFSYKYGSAMAVDPPAPAPAPIPAPASVPAPAPTPRPTRQEVTPGPPQQNASPINLPVQGAPLRAPDVSHAKKPAQAPNMDARLTQMVDDLVGPEEDDDLPTTPPMAYYVDPTVADGEDDMSNSLGSLDASIDGRKASTSRAMARQSPVRRPSAAGWAQQGTRSRTPLQPIQSSTDPWLGGLPPQSSPSLPHPNQRNSPSSAVRRGSSAQAHTRVNSAHAIPMLPLDNTPEGLSSIDPTPQGPATFGPSLTTRAPFPEIPLSGVWPGVGTVKQTSGVSLAPPANKE
ncbi:hypothetical protein M8818_007584 [Zalaria obscura]|uniref:Uncharacterized protein n=1 Tax=Zalaria obscura TaxID=2024903 RepID=A0ACC3S423_9PEZI